MPALPVLLRTGIASRLEALRRELADLQGALPRGNRDLHAALDLLAAFPETAANEVDQWTDGAVDETAAVVYLRSMAEHVGTVFQLVHDVALSAIQMADEVTLKRLVEDECAALGLGDRTVLVCASRPGRIHTDTSNLYERVYGTFEPDDVRRERLEPAAPFLIVNVPTYEGLHARWIPWVLGHELAHVKIHELDLDQAVNSIPTEEFERWKTLEHGVWVPAADTGIAPAWEAWVREVLCDAYAVHRFGPGALLAIADFHEAIGGYRRITRTHPPGHLRIRLMASWLQHRAVDLLTESVNAWAAEPPPAKDALEESFSELLTNRAEELFEIASDMAPELPIDRSPLIAQELLNGIPGAPIVTTPSAPAEPISIAEIVNGAWIAHQSPPDDDDLPPIDRLADHALSILNLTTKWTTAGGTLQVLDGDAADQGDNVGRQGTLAHDAIVAHMLRDDDPLVVTPLFEGALGAASLDIRLGNRFIVLQRSAAPAFTPLEQTGDPRLMQVAVTRDWGEPLVLHPGELVLGATLEYLVVPSDITAQVITRSSYGRLGIISATAVQVQPGFRGCLTLELVNLGEIPLQIQPGERIAQLVFSTVVGPTQATSKYDCPTGPEFSRVREDPDASVLRAMQTGL